MIKITSIHSKKTYARFCTPNRLREFVPKMAADLKHRGYTCQGFRALIESSGELALYDSRGYFVSNTQAHAPLTRLQESTGVTTVDENQGELFASPATSPIAGLKKIVAMRCLSGDNRSVVQMAHTRFMLDELRKIPTSRWLLVEQEAHGVNVYLRQQPAPDDTKADSLDAILDWRDRCVNDVNPPSEYLQDALDTLWTWFPDEREKSLEALIRACGAVEPEIPEVKISLCLNTNYSTALTRAAAQVDSPEWLDNQKDIRMADIPKDKLVQLMELTGCGLQTADS